MAELIHKHSAHVRTPDGEVFTARVCGERRRDGLWTAWLEFDDRLGHVVLRTEAETTQPSRDALDYWASGLEPVYVKGAFTRAQLISGG
jgi:translation initiation factor IF-1